MNKETQHTLIVWLKRILGVTAIALWMGVIYTIAKSPAPFMEQAPFCMVSTMLIFGLLTGAFKGLEYWEQNNG